MTEFVTHKIEVGLPSQRDRKEADHLMQRHTPINNQVFSRPIHIRIHLLVHQPEGNGFISHQSLIMRLAVSYRLNRPQSIDHHVPHLPDVPLLIGYLL